MKNILKKAVLYILLVEAKILLWRFRPTVVAITGSVGKTGAKEAIYQTLTLTGKKIRKSPKSFNSDIGVALTILGLPNAWNNPVNWLSNMVRGIFKIVFTLPKNYPDILIVEVGADKPGDIARLSTLLRPDVVVITAIPDIPSHIEFFDSPEQVADEKFQLIKQAKESAVLVYNEDSEFVVSRAMSYRGKKVSYGTTSANANVYLRSLTVKCDKKNLIYMNYVICAQGRCYEGSRYDNLGRQSLYAVLAAIGVGSVLKLDTKEQIKNLEKMSPVPGRMRVLPAIYEGVIIDDSYNASPESTLSGLEFVKDVACIEGRKILALGDMAELGAFSKRGHIRVLKEAVVSADKVFITGKKMIDASKEVSGNNIYNSKDLQELTKRLERELREGDLLYVKGSQSSRMEKVVNHFVIHNLRNTNALVRQEQEWQIR